MPLLRHITSIAPTSTDLKVLMWLTAFQTPLSTSGPPVNLAPLEERQPRVLLSLEFIIAPRVWTHVDGGCFANTLSNPSKLIRITGSSLPRWGPQCCCECSQSKIIVNPTYYSQVFVKCIRDLKLFENSNWAHRENTFANNLISGDSYLCLHVIIY